MGNYNIKNTHCPKCFQNNEVVEMEYKFEFISVENGCSFTIYQCPTCKNIEVVI